MCFTGCGKTRDRVGKMYLRGLKPDVFSIIYGTVENHLGNLGTKKTLSVVFITLGEPQAHGDTTKVMP
jgi:hypothetical protein